MTATLLIFPQPDVRPPLSRLHDRNQDPLLGELLPATALSAMPGRQPVKARHEPSGPRNTLVVAAGSCSGCSLSKFDPRKLPLDTFAQVVVFYESKASDLAKIGPASPDLFLVADPDGRVHQSLNASWRPRLFVIDRSSRLLWMQSWPDQKLGESVGGIQ